MCAPVTYVRYLKRGTRGAAQCVRDERHRMVGSRAQLLECIGEQVRDARAEADAEGGEHSLGAVLPQLELQRTREVSEDLVVVEEATVGVAHLVCRSARARAASATRHIPATQDSPLSVAAGREPPRQRVRSGGAAFDCGGGDSKR
jgi:hypothetical protein